MALTIVRLPSSTQIGSFLTQASASATYLTQASASNTYLPQASASSTYLTQASASSTYQPKDADLTAIAEGVWTSGLLNKIAPNTWGTITDNSTNWNTAYTDRNKWDGGATGLIAATGRTSLGLGTMATAATTDYAALEGATFTGNVSANTLISSNSSGSEGGEIRLATPATGTSITTGVTIDVQTNLFRIFETGGTNRGVSLDITSLPAGVSSQIALRSNTTFIGTTSIALNRTSAAQTLTGVSLSSGAAIGSLTFTSGTISSTGSIALSPATGSNETALNAIVRMPDVYNRTTTAASNMLIATVPLAEVFRSTASSQRWKNSIDNLAGELEASKLLDIPVRQFKFNNDYLNQEDKRYDTLVPGFVAEEVAEYYPIAAEMGEDGKVDDWNVRMIIPPMLKLIQDQDKKIKELETRISSIENN